MVYVCMYGLRDAVMVVGFDEMRASYLSKYWHWSLVEVMGVHQLGRIPALAQWPEAVKLLVLVVVVVRRGAAVRRQKVWEDVRWKEQGS